jgi:pilus assembly protein CpaB
MKPKTIALLVVAITCGLVASYMTSRLLAERSSAPEETKVPILMAKMKVPAFTPIKDPEKYFEMREMAEGSFPSKAIKSFDDVRGKSLQRALSKDLPVTPDDLISVDAMGIQAELPPGMRAVSLKVNPETIVGGFVTPKSHVDVIYVARRGDDASVAKIILQNMLVLAVDIKDKREDGTTVYLGTTVTLAAKPEEAAELALAGSMGEIRLTLRGAGDNRILTMKDTTPRDFGKGRFSDGSADEAPDTSAPAVKPLTTPSIGSLPPVEEKTPGETVKIEDKPLVEEKPVETHEMTITIGADSFKAKFIKDEKEGWKNSLNADTDDTPAKPKTATPSQPGSSQPGAKGADGKPKPNG